MVINKTFTLLKPSDYGNLYKNGNSANEFVYLYENLYFNVEILLMDNSILNIKLSIFYY